MSASIHSPFCHSTLWSSEPGSGVRMKNSRMSSGSSFLMISMSSRIDSGVSNGKAEDVARRGDGAGVLPGEQHLAVFGDLVLALLGGDEVGGVDAFEADQHAVGAGAGGLLDEVRDLVAQRVDLDHQPDVHLVAFAQLDDPVEDRLPVLVAGEIVVGDEEVPDAVRPVLADRALDVVRRAAARFPALHVDDGAERALIGTAAAGIEARQRLEWSVLRCSTGRIGVGSDSSDGRSFR